MSTQALRVALVMGAGGALARAIAVAFARQGYRIAANDLAPDQLDLTASAVQSVGGVCQVYGFDAARKMPVQALIGEVVETWERLDVLVNAGIVMPAAGALEMDEWDWHRTLDMNLAGPYFAIQVAGRVMREQGGGSIVNLLLDPLQLAGLPGRSALTASQSALVALTRAAALELEAYHVRINAISLRVASESDSSLAAQPGRLAYRPLTLVARYESVAAQALELCAPGQGGVNGKIIAL